MTVSGATERASDPEGEDRPADWRQYSHNPYRSVRPTFAPTVTEIDSLRDLFVHELRGAYHMELRLVDIVDEMAANATNDRISEGFETHREETEQHAERVRSVFEAIGLPPEERECAIVEALDRERRTVEEAVEDPDMLNLFYLGAGMKTERVEVTTYDSLLVTADKLGLDDEVTDPLETNRDDEEDTLDTLRMMAGASEVKTLWERFMP